MACCARQQFGIQWKNTATVTMPQYWISLWLIWLWQQEKHLFSFYMWMRWLIFYNRNVLFVNGLQLVPTSSYSSAQLFRHLANHHFLIFKETFWGFEIVLACEDWFALRKYILNIRGFWPWCNVTWTLYEINKLLSVLVGLIRSLSFFAFKQCTVFHPLVKEDIALHLPSLVLGD